MKLFGIELRHVRELVLVVAAQAGSAIALIVAVKVLTRVLVPAAYGHIAIVTSYVVGAMTVLAAPVTGAGMVEYHDAVRSDRELELTGTLFLASIVSMLIPLAVLAVPAPALVSAALCYLAAELFKTPVVTMTGTARRRASYATLMILDAWGKIAIVVAVMQWIPLTAEVVILSYAANSFLTGLLGWTLILKNGMRAPGHAFFSPDALRIMFRSGWSFAGIGFGAWVINLSDRVILSFFVSAAAVGIYVTASQAAMIVPSGLSALITGMMNPVLLQKQSTAPADAAVHLGRAILFTVWVILPASAVALSDPELLVRALASHQYVVAATLLWLLVPALACLAVTNTAAIAFWMSKRVKVYFAVVGGAGALNVILNVLLVPRLGVLAAAISTLATYGSQLIGVLLLGRRYVGWRLRMRELAPLVCGVVAFVFAVLLLRDRVQPIVRAVAGVCLYFATSVAVFMMLRKR